MTPELRWALPGQQAGPVLRRFRMAPTPSGYLHEGNAFNFILTAARARVAGGMLRLRIDDLDAPRVRTEYLEDIFESLRWLGIRWDEGPETTLEHRERHSQSLRLPVYDVWLRRLADTGRVFACTCSRTEVLARSPGGLYPGTCRDRGLSLRTPGAAWRIDTGPDAWVEVRDRRAGIIRLNVAETTPYFIIRRRDGLSAYHVASLADDTGYGSTDIVRGVDLLHSTAAQYYLSAVLGAAAFDAVTFEHHPLLLEDDGLKLSKSAGAASLRAQRDAGHPVSALYARFSAWMGWSEPTADLEAVVRYMALT